MKRTILLIVLVSMLIGCGGSGGTTKEKPGNKPSMKMKKKTDTSSFIKPGEDPELLLEELLPLPEDFTKSYKTVCSNTYGPGPITLMVLHLIVPNGISREELVDNIRHAIRYHFDITEDYKVVGNIFYRSTGQKKGRAIAGFIFSHKGIWQEDEKTRKPLSEFKLRVDFFERFIDKTMTTDED